LFQFGKTDYLEKDLIIQVSPEEVEIALLEDKVVVEYHKDRREKRLSVGDVYLGTVTKIMAGLNAAFVDIGSERDAFLHFTDLGVHFKTFKKYAHLVRNRKLKNPILKDFRYEENLVKTDQISNNIKAGDQFLIQVEKEPISTKGARLSAEIDLPGRYFILSPFQSHLRLSKNIRSSSERKRILRLVESIKPPNFGIIIRTVAEGKKAAELNQDLQGLINKWKTLSSNLAKQGSKKARYVQVLQEEIKTKSLLRDVLNKKFSKVIVNNKDYFDEIKEYTSTIAPGLEKIVQHYTNSKPLFDNYFIRRQIKAAFRPIFNLSRSSYLVIEKTEALYVVDVNSGNKVDASKSSEDNAFTVNMDAAKAIARLLRLRDIGGIIIIDFIDMKNPDNRKNVQLEMKNLMGLDKAKHTILPLSRFGLMQITRQRVRPELNVDTTESCPLCNGNGEVSSSILLIEEIENKIDYLFEEKKKHDAIKLFCHPYVASHLKHGLLSKQRSWWWKHKKWIEVVPDESYYITQFAFYNKEGKLSLH
jgi:ribonuclease G